MDGSGAYYASRTELLEWLNSVLPEPAAAQLQLRKVEGCKSGIPYAILLAEIYPNLRNVIAKRLKGASVGIVSMIASGNPNDANYGHQPANVSEYDSHHNMKMVQDILSKNHISRLVEVDRIAKGHFPSNLEFLQWFRKFSTDFGIQAQPVATAEEEEDDQHQHHHQSEADAAAAAADEAACVDQYREADDDVFLSASARQRQQQQQQQFASEGGEAATTPIDSSRSRGTTSVSSSANATARVAGSTSLGGRAGLAERGSAAQQQPQPLRSTSGSRHRQLFGGAAQASTPTPAGSASASNSTSRLLNHMRTVSPRNDGPLVGSPSGGGGQYGRSPSSQSRSGAGAVGFASTPGRTVGGPGGRSNVSSASAVLAQQRSSSSKRLSAVGGGAVADRREDNVGFRQSAGGGAATARSTSGSASHRSSAAAVNSNSNNNVHSSPSAFTRTSGPPSFASSPQQQQGQGATTAHHQHVDPSDEIVEADEAAADCPPHHSSHLLAASTSTSKSLSASISGVGVVNGSSSGGIAGQQQQQQHRGGGGSVAPPAAAAVAPSATELMLSPRTRSALTSAELKNFRARIAAAASVATAVNSANANNNGSASNADSFSTPVRNGVPATAATVSLKNAAPMYGSPTTGAADAFPPSSAAPSASSAAVPQPAPATDYGSLSPQTQAHLLTQLQTSVARAESERDFYYDKLRMIEALLNRHELSGEGGAKVTGGGRRASGSTSSSAAAGGALAEAIRSVLLSADNEVC